MSYRLPAQPIVAPFNHVITYVPRLNLFLDSTAQFAPMGTLPQSVADKPVLIAATGQLKRTPSADPARDFTHDIVTVAMGADGSLSGRSITHTGGQHEVESRRALFEQQDQEQDSAVILRLGSLGNSGPVEYRHPDPVDLSVPWVLQQDLERGAMVNLPGPAAMALPLGLASGEIKSVAWGDVLPGRRFKAGCSSSRLVEEVEFKFPEGTRVERIPPDVDFSRGPLRYQARYRLQGQVLHSRREFTSRRSGAVCSARDDEDLEALQTVLRRDLRGQVFLR
jgi:hypothetical protein